MSQAVWSLITEPPENFPLLERFINKIEVDPIRGCWIWTAGYTSDGRYGKFKIDGKTITGHRYAHETLFGPIKVGLHRDHLCRRWGCVNPFHLEVVSGQVNTLRGIGPSAQNAVKTHCKYGHAFTKENTRIDKRGSRHCKICCNNRVKACYEKKKKI